MISVLCRAMAVFALRDMMPVTPVHTLVLPYRHAPIYFDLTDSELAAANDLLRILRSEILRGDSTVEEFNVGANVESVSGQTVFHCHIHLIPRRKGGIDDPLGGVREVISKQGALLNARQIPLPLTSGETGRSVWSGDGVRLSNRRYG
jgi:diadenosine tetraphosphate (Ap4A) HIT family hydrolase